MVRLVCTECISSDGLDILDAVGGDELGEIGAVGAMFSISLSRQQLISPKIAHSGRIAPFLKKEIRTASTRRAL